MTQICVLSFLFLPLLFHLVSAAKCPTSISCGKIGNIQYPFTTTERPDCGVLAISGCSDRNLAANKSIQLRRGRSYDVLGFYQRTVVIRDDNLHRYLRSESCDVFNKNITLPPSSPLASFNIKNNITMYKCNNTLNSSPLEGFYNYSNCSGYNVFYACPNGYCQGIKYPRSVAACSTILLPVREPTDSNNPFTFLSSEIHIQAQLSDNCSKCLYQERGQCHLDRGSNFYCSKDQERGRSQLDRGRNFNCSKDNAGSKSWVWKLSLGIGIPAITITIVLLIALRYKRKFGLSKVQIQRRHTDSHSGPDPESTGVYISVPIFSYMELQQATNNFDDTRKLGDGGYGTVYYAKLKDGREVAVKRLYDHNYSRVQQFMNEVKILTHLHHKNLVSLYGCTSRHSHELLLVYEYIPNSIVACHLHGHLANFGLLLWPIRMKIAIEIASALTYLHASNIIHRDAKTNNILLDNNYCVKVADFGLSRFFPNNVTHVSTTPQGTLGYVDPKYHQCYQLTSKSDVYSFRVVLIELISSMSPIDMTRRKDEINLANLAMNKIRRGAIDELVDGSLGFHSNNDVKRAITSTGELAFRCLQGVNQLRPSMDEVLEVLIKIENGRDELEDMTQEWKTNLCNVLSDRDKVRLSKGTRLISSPTTVTENWESENTTPNMSR